MQTDHEESTGRSPIDASGRRQCLDGLEHGADLDRFGAFNERYAAAFPEPRPARSAFEVSRLPFDANVEIEAWAHRDRA